MLTACGQAGDLYLPDEPLPVEPVAEKSPEPTVDVITPEKKDDADDTERNKHTEPEHF